ncbi:MAG: hypothetical protein EPN37_11865 [Chitinophagaceae bacterium]|nr:MAG: hypothetical protein EPN37_11865 [Chitinophagaceae bacterium]
MKKLSLKALNLNGVEVLTREQLKNVLGGQQAQTTVIICGYTYIDSAGISHSGGGECSGSLDQCNQSAIQMCLSGANLSGGCCDSTSCDVFGQGIA